MAQRDTVTVLDRSAADSVSAVVDALRIPGTEYRDMVRHEFLGIAMTMRPLAHRALVLGEPVSREHLATVTECARHLLAGGVRLGTVLSYTPVALAQVCSRGSTGRAEPAPVDAAQWVHRSAAYSQKLAMVCLDVWQSTSSETAAPLVPVPGASLPAVADEGEPAPLESLDAQILLMVAEGQSNQQIAQAMSYSSQAVRWRLARLMRRWRVANRAALVTVGFQRGLLRRPARRAELLPPSQGPR